VIESILPAGAVAEEAFADPPGLTLYPAEEAVVARAVDKQRREFTTARACARAALARLGVPPGPIVPGPRGAPQWPAGVVGSMTHCDGYRAAVVARHRDLVAIGVDAEPHAPLPVGVLGTVTSAAERAHLTALAVAGSGRHWDRMLFSAKESVYKAWFPLTGRWLGFEDAAVTIDPAGGTFTARPYGESSPPTSCPATSARPSTPSAAPADLRAGMRRAGLLLVRTRDVPFVRLARTRLVAAVGVPGRSQADSSLDYPRERRSQCVANARYTARRSPTLSSSSAEPIDRAPRTERPTLSRAPSARVRPPRGY
jgi:4'-phosphopantetheinyl transferase EntD